MGDWGRGDGGTRKGCVTDWRTLQSASFALLLSCWSGYLLVLELSAASVYWMLAVAVNLGFKRKVVKKGFLRRFSNWCPV